MPLDAVLVSDVHVDGPGCERQAAFLRFLGGLPCTAPPTLLLLGDIFHTWWHRGDESFAQFAPVVRALADFPLFYVPGNHDFHAPAFFAGRGATVPVVPHAIGSSLTPTLGGVSAFVTHGDQVDNSAGYRALHAVLRSPAFGRLMATIPPGAQWSFLHRLAGHARGVPSALGMARQHTMGARASPGHALVAMGHTHAPELVRHPSFTYLNTGDWVEHRTYGTVRDGVVELARFDS